MLPHIDNDILKTGFCWGQYELRIDDSCRLRLCKEIVASLAERKIFRLWRCPDPESEGFVLCPMDHRLTFIDAVTHHLKDAPDAEERFRLLCSGTDVAIDRQSRIRIQKVCLEHARIKPPQQVTVLGVGYWYEITRWRLKKEKDLNT